LINTHLKAGNKRPILDTDMIEDQMRDYSTLLKKLCKE